MSASKVGIATTGVLLCAVALGGFAITKIDTPDPSGVWVDLNDDSYFIVFRSDGTYVESTYNMPRQYEFKGNRLSLTSISGEITTSILEKNLGERLVADVNGVTRVFELSEESPELKNHSNTETNSGVAGMYVLKDNFGAEVKLTLREDKTYTYSSGSGKSVGMYCQSNIGDILLMNEAGEVVETFVKWQNGTVLGKMNSSVNFVGDGHLSGVASSLYSDMSVVFSPDGNALVNFESMNSKGESLGDASIGYTYTVSDSGLVTLTEKTGVGGTTYLYVDPYSGDMYRYVFETDDWFDFLTGGA